MRLKNILKINLSLALKFGLSVGVPCALMFFIFLQIRYGDIWFADFYSNFIFFLYIIGQYAGWVLVFNLLLSMFVSLFQLIFRKQDKPSNPKLFYFLSAIYIQVLFWLEVFNIIFFYTSDRLLKTRISVVIVFFLVTILFLAIYIILKKLFKFKEHKGRFKIPKIAFTGMILILFFLSFTYSNDARLKQPDNSHPEIEPAYDSEGKYWDEDYLPPNENYNVLLFSIDMLRADHVDCCGGQKGLTPFLDSLSTTGVAFTNFRAISPYTLPSHGTMLSSLYPSEHGAFRPPVSNKNHGKDYDRLKLSTTTVMEILNNFGFATYGYSGGGYISSTFGYFQGFDYYKDDNSNLGLFTTAEEFIRDYDNSRPLFLFLHTYLVHSYSPSPKYESMYCDTTFRIEHKALENDLFFRGHNNIGRFKKQPRKADRLRNLYAATVRECDDLMRSLFYTLESEGFLDNTIIFITSDHGEEFWEHRGTTHGRTYYDELMRVPLIIVFPPEFDFKGVVIDQPFSLLDIVPTILDALHLPPQVSAHGTSLLPVIRGEKSLDYIFYFEANRNEEKLGMMQGEYKYIFNGLPPIEKRIFRPDLILRNMRTVLFYQGDELYNLVDDTFEKNNLAQQYPEMVVKMREKAMEDYYVRFLYFSQADIITSEGLSTEDLEKLKALGYVH